MKLKLLETEVIQKRIEDYNKENIAITYWVDSLSEEVNAYHDIGWLHLLVIQKIKQLNRINKELNKDSVIDRLRAIKGKIDLKVLRGDTNDLHNNKRWRDTL